MSYADDVADALEQISEDGRDITIVKRLQGIFIPTTNSFSGGSSAVNAKTKAVFTQYKSQDIDGTKIQSGDLLLLVPAVTPEPDTSSKIIDGDQEYSIISVQKIQPGDTIIFYKVQVRA